MPRQPAAGVLDRRLHASDLRGELNPARRRQLRTLFSERNLGSDSLGAGLYSGTGELVAAPSAGWLTAPRPELITRAKTGAVVSAVVDSGSDKVLRTLLPVRIGAGATGAVQLDQDYGKIAAAARRTSFVVPRRFSRPCCSGSA